MPISDIANGESGASARAKINAIKTLAEATEAGKQPLDATLTALAALTLAANKMIYATGADAVATTDISANGRSLVGAADYAAMRTLLGLVIGTNVQAYDADLAAIAALVSAADKALYSTGAGTWALADFTAAGRELINDASAAAQRTTLGVGTGDSPQFVAVVTGAGSASSNALHSSAGATGGINFPSAADTAFASTSAEVARVVNGAFLVGKTATSLSTAGLQVGVGGSVTATVAGTVATFNRTGSDGVIVNFAVTDSTKGQISAAGETVTYASFCAVHWSQWHVPPAADDPVGTVVSTVDELCEWLAVEWHETIPAQTRPIMREFEVTEDREIMRAEPVYAGRGRNRRPTGKFVMVGTGQTEKVVVGTAYEDTGEVEVTTPEQTVRGYRLHDGPGAVGDTIPITSDMTGQTVLATVVREVNTTLPRIVVCDTDLDPNVYGARSATDEDGDEHVAAIGVHPVRVRAGEAPVHGSLLVSAGGGCARVLDPDTPITARIHAAIIGKVICTIPCLVHPDGSFNLSCSMKSG